MKLAIPTIAQADLEVANSAEIGAEKTVKVSTSPTLEIGELDQISTGPLWIPDNGYAAPAGTSGYDFAVICANGVRSTAQIVITFAVTFDGSGTPAGTATATFAPPARVTDQGFNFPVGIAVDLTGAGTNDQVLNDVTLTSASAIITSASGRFTAADAGKTVAGTGITGGTTILSVQSQTSATMSANATASGTNVAVTITARSNAQRQIRSITGVVSVTGGAAGNKFLVVAFPDAWYSVMCSTDKNPTLPVPKTIPIACGYNGSRWIKKGRSEPGSLELTTKYINGMEGLMRLNGLNVSVMLETTKEDYLLTERLVIGNWRPATQPRSPDGDGEAEARATGNFEVFALFV